jgi:hypothetical protein
MGKVTDCEAVGVSQGFMAQVYNLQDGMNLVFSGI